MRCSLASSFVLNLSNVRPCFYENSRITEFGSSRRWKSSVITSEGVAGDTMKLGSSSLITRRISSADTPFAVCPTAAQQAPAPLLEALKSSAEKMLPVFTSLVITGGKLVQD